MVSGPPSLRLLKELICSSGRSQAYRVWLKQVEPSSSESEHTDAPWFQARNTALCTIWLKGLDLLRMALS